MLKRAKQKGFTLIELVVVIVILGILAAVVAPRFIDLTSQANTAVQQGACGALASAAVMLYASTKASNSCASIKAQMVIPAGMTAVGPCSGVVVTASGSTAPTTCTAIDPAICTTPNC